MKSDTLKSKSFLSTRSLVTVSLLIAISIVLARIFGIMVPVAGLPALKINFSAVPLLMAGIFYGPLAGFIAGALSDVIGYIINPMGPYFPGFTITTALTGMIPGLIFKTVRNNPRLSKLNFNYINAGFIALMTVGLGYAFYLKGVLTFDQGIAYNGIPIHTAMIALIGAIVLAYAAIPFYIDKTVKFESKLYAFDKIYFVVSVTQMICSLMLNTYFLSIMFGKGFLVFLPTRIMTNYIMIPMYTIIIIVLMKALRLEKEY
jgi:riboflavin transporter